MKRNKYWKIACLFMLTTLLALSGCNAGQEGTEKVSGSNAGQDDTNEGAVSSSDSDSQETSRLMGDYDTLYDRALVEGKLACYFLCPGGELAPWTRTNYGGDAVLFILPDGTTILNDCGTQVDGPQVVWKLQQLGIEKLDYFILSHGHTDHVGGFSILARHIEIGQIYAPPQEVMERSDPEGKLFTMIVEEMGIPFTYLKEGDTLTFGDDVSVKFFNPPVGFGADTSINLNESSLVWKLTYGDSSFLMTGDIGNNPDYGQKTEEVLVAKYGNELQADVCKAGHHGSDKVMGSDIWKQTVNAKIYAFTTAYVRDDVEYFKYALTGAKTFSNALDGDVLVYTTGDGTYDVQVAKERTSDYYGTLDTVDGHMRVE
ncbi:MAG: MBL fold metallo-hydrolase [Tyzzerella sp.]|nr:MBL fold metallo-hydrolase [Tyzzerella sp.]